MKKILLVVSLLMGGIPGLVSAETIPYSNNFEIADSDGQSIFSNSAYASWTGSSEVSAVITNGDASPLSVAYIGTPMAGTHSRILKFSDGTITNSVDGTSVDLVGIDTMIQPSLTQDLDTNSTATAAFSNAQFAIAFLTNGVAVWHGVQTEPYLTATQTWSILNVGSPAITSGKWYRLTLTLNYKGLPTFEDIIYNPMFQIKIDGQPLTSPYGHVSADLGSGTNGSWLSMASASPIKMSSMVLSGSGMMDDLVLNSGAIPDYVTPTNFIPYGWLTFMGVDTSSGMGEAEVGDDDNDGMKNWEEYIAGTHPTNAASKFIIVSQIISNGKPQISWLGTAISPYTIESSTNLIETNWVNEALSSATGSGTNMWEPATSPTNSVKFYRVQIK